MDGLLIALVVILAFLNAGVLVFLFTRKKEGGGEGLSLIQQQIGELTRTLDARAADSLKQTQESMHRQHSESSRLIKERTEEITSVKEIGRETGKFAEQLKGLQDILKNPKQRGILGEYYLETVLKNVFPPGSYQMQYMFKNGEIVDAAVFENKKIAPIDSKFSLDNYNRYVPAEGAERIAFEKAFVNDLKLRITETAKYIRPEEDTMDFAFMFIPSEGIYYDLLTNQVGAGEEENLLQRAISKYKVFIVSPTSFLAYLQTVMQGLKALQIEQKAVQIQKQVGELGKHLGAYEEYMNKLGNTPQTTVNHYTSAYKEFGKIDKDVMKIAGESAGVSPVLVAGPDREE